MAVVVELMVSCIQVQQLVVELRMNLVQVVVVLLAQVEELLSCRQVQLQMKYQIELGLAQLVVERKAMTWTKAWVLSMGLQKG